MTRRALALTWVLALLCGWPLNSYAQSSDHPLIAAPGFQPDRDYFSLQSFEHIDTLSGGLILTFTDLSLPGNAGRQLRIQRTYSSKSLKWAYGVAGVAMKITEPPLPQGTPDVMEGTPTLHMSDGGSKRMGWSTTTSGTLVESTSRDFWKYNRSTRMLFVPNGDSCHYEVEDQYLLRVDYCHDVFGNLTDFTWDDQAADPMHDPPLPARVQLTITQYLTVNTTREITLIQNAGTGNLMSLTYDGDSWEYVEDTNGDVIEVNLPDSTGGWAFTYSSGRLASLETPYGGTIAYTYEQKLYAGPETPQVNYQTWVISRRDTDGENVAEGTWTYAYDWQFGNGVSLETTIESPSGRTIHRRVAAEWCDAHRLQRGGPSRCIRRGSGACPIA